MPEVVVIGVSVVKSSVVTGSVEGANVVAATVVSTTVVGANVVGLATVTASVVGDISQLTPEKPIKRPCVTKAYTLHLNSEQHMVCPLSAADKMTAPLYSISILSKPFV